MLSAMSFMWFSVSVLVNVAFFTLLERKILGLSQTRKGPNKVSVSGILQPISDAMKLFLKNFIIPYKSSSVLFYLSPFLAVMLVLMLWQISPEKFNHLSMTYSSALFLVILGLNVYPLFISGWASNSKYALLGFTRGIAQSISYEISLALILFMALTATHSLSLESFSDNFKTTTVVMFLPGMMAFWMLCCVAETNRAPFDFAEGESELVSGFNVEYGSCGFALIFLAEYGSILFLSYLTGFVMMGGWLEVEWMLAMSFIWVWLRSTLPRYRYDKLMLLAWKNVLPAVIFMTMFFLPCSTL